MINISSNFDSPQASAEIEAGVLFVDLDDTLIQGNTAGMTDEELKSAPVIEKTIALINQAITEGIPVVLVTRNNSDRVEQVLELRPELRPLFDDTIGIPEGQKSGAINSYLKAKGNEKTKAVFIDDNIEETTDVHENSDQVIAIHPDNTGQLKVKQAEESHQDIIEKDRPTISSLLTHSNYINLPA